MKITKVKKVGSKYLINDSLLVPLVQGNRYYNKLSEWLKKVDESTIESEPVEIDASEIESNYSKKKNKLLKGSGYDIAMPSWETQRMEAIMHLYIKEAPTPFLDGLAEARGETTRVVAKKILHKSNDYLKKLGKLTGQMQKELDSKKNSIK